MVGSDDAAPYTFDWDSAGAGASATIAAEAFDEAGNSTVSASRIVTVFHPDVTPPVVALTAPADGATVSGTVALTVDASDNVGVAEVEFLVDGDVVGTDSNAPFTVEWDTSAASTGRSRSRRAPSTSRQRGRLGTADGDGLAPSRSSTGRPATGDPPPGDPPPERPHGRRDAPVRGSQAESSTGGAAHASVPAGRQPGPTQRDASDHRARRRRRRCAARGSEVRVAARDAGGIEERGRSVLRPGTVVRSGRPQAAPCAVSSWACAARDGSSPPWRPRGEAEAIDLAGNRRRSARVRVDVRRTASRRDSQAVFSVTVRR